MNQEDDKWLKYSHMNKEHFTAQFTGFSLISSLISHPFTVLAVRQQVGSSITNDYFSKGNVINKMVQAYHKIGIKGLFRGFLPLAVLGTPSNLIYISTIEASREYFQEKYRKMFPKMSSFSIDLLQAISSSIIANFLSIIPYVPGEVISSRSIIQGREGLSTNQMMHQMYREQGYRGFFRGFNSSLIVGVVLSSQWWWTYSTCKRFSHSLSFYENNSIVCDGASGLLAGMSSAAAAHPFDTVKTMIMTSSGSGSSSSGSSVGASCQRFLPTLIHTVKREGVLRLYKGLPAMLYQSALGSGIFALCYEIIKKSSHAASSDREVDSSRATSSEVRL